jgi:hypothetical protein
LQAVAKEQHKRGAQKSEREGRRLSLRQTQSYSEKKFIVGFSFVFGDVLRLLIIASIQTKNTPKIENLKTSLYIYVSQKQRKYKIFSKFLSL